MIDAGRPARLAVGVVSAGRVGSVLGAALERAGHHVVAASGVSKASVRRAAELLPDTPLLPPDEVCTQADLVLLAVPDDVLPGLVRGLAAAGCFRPGQIVVHTAGSQGTAVLEPAAAQGVLPLALHPAMTFTGRPEDVERLASCCIGVTAPGEAGEDDPGADPRDAVGWSVAEALVLEMSAEPVRVPEAMRPLYHAALAHGANHLMTLVGDCIELLETAGIRPAGRLVAPLLSAALDNALRHGDRALTGPVARGDAGTLRTHLDRITAADPGLAAAYRALAGRTARRAAAAGLLDQAGLDDVEKTLEET
ncbi:Ketopantoate reductase PanG [Pseudonocardia sp. Ae168_Ps1]|nr:Ketopantoate reductase PanG [Pseudonocardia sp. Ae150A_Ps1]OLL80691.1 Ketopantoate reductase PanG [Pseudonocardia sp. Ae168_Ps1]OLL85182.1 Ketopantoate reductase PanG [Pseudonocardia sp. Ae263_Ps1]OLL94793.1 Ketopantoate reductase PanG [Pseudonocardia sp. Ae356_Ps1]